MLAAVRDRRSIRKYEERPVEREVIDQLQEAMLRAPSSRNFKPWRFVFVTDRELLRSLSQSKPRWSDFLSDAALGVVICADPAVSDCWIEDCSIAATVLQLSATDLGLGSCWIQIRDRQHADARSAEEYVREVLGLPAGFRVVCMVSIGYPAEEKAPREREGLHWEKVGVRG